MTDIKWANLVGEHQTVDDGGYVSNLMKVASSHIDSAVKDNRLTKAQAGEIYTTMIPAAFNTGLQFLLQEQTVEAQVDKARIDVEISQANKILLERQIAKIEQEIELAKVDADDRHKQSSTQVIGLERDIASKEQAVRLADASDVRAEAQHTEQLLTASKQREGITTDNVLKERQVSKVEQDIGIAATVETDRHVTQLKQDLQLDDSLTTSKTQRVKLERDISQTEQTIKLSKVQSDDAHNQSVKGLEQIAVAIVQAERNVSKVEQDITLSKIQSEDSLKNTLKDRESKTIQDTLVSRNITNAEKDIATKAQQVLNLQEDNLVKKQQVLKGIADVVAVERQIASTEKSIEATVENIAGAKVNKNAVIAKTINDHGRNPGTDTVSVVDDTSTTHYYSLEVAKHKVAQEEIGIAIASKSADKMDVDKMAVEISTGADYGQIPSAYTLKYIDALDAEVSTNIAYGGSIPTNVKEVLSITPAGTHAVNTSNLSAINASSTAGDLPPSRFHAEMLKSRVEANVGIQTTKGYLGDAFYKQTKVLQELTFSLANAGVITKENTDDSTGVYAKIVKALEMSMNGQTKVYGVPVEDDTVHPFVNLDTTVEATAPTID